MHKIYSFFHLFMCGAVLLFDLFFHLIYQNFLDAMTVFLVTNITIWLDCNKALAFFLKPVEYVTYEKTISNNAFICLMAGIY